MTVVHTYFYIAYGTRAIYVYGCYVM